VHHLHINGESPSERAIRARYERNAFAKSSLSAPNYKNHDQDEGRAGSLRQSKRPSGRLSLGSVHKRNPTSLGLPEAPHQTFADDSSDNEQPRAGDTLPLPQRDSSPSPIAGRSKGSRISALHATKIQAAKISNGYFAARTVDNISSSDRSRTISTSHPKVTGRTAKEAQASKKSALPNAHTQIGESPSENSATDKVESTSSSSRSRTTRTSRSVPTDPRRGLLNQESGRGRSTSTSKRKTKSKIYVGDDLSENFPDEESYTSDPSYEPYSDGDTLGTENSDTDVSVDTKARTTRPPPTESRPSASSNRKAPSKAPAKRSSTSKPPVKAYPVANPRREESPRPDPQDSESSSETSHAEASNHLSLETSGKISIDPFRPYGEKRPSRDIENDILSAIDRNRKEAYLKKQEYCRKKKKAASFDPDSNGHIYLFTWPEFPKYVKIGVTTSTPHDRIKQWSKTCKNVTYLRLENPQDRRFKFAWIAERVIHAELFNQRRKFACPTCKRNPGGRPAPPVKHNKDEETHRDHGEWFEISTEQALAVTQRWIKWFVQNDPYEYDMSLRGHWAWKAARARANLKKGIDLESWTFWAVWDDYCFYISEISKFRNQYPQVASAAFGAFVVLYLFVFHIR
jgi:hypothetical protein